MPKYYCVQDISEMLGVNPETVRRWIRTGRLKAEKRCNKWGSLISDPSLNQFLSENPKYKIRSENRVESRIENVDINEERIREIIR